MSKLLTSSGGHLGLFPADGFSTDRHPAVRVRRRFSDRVELPVRWRFQRPSDHDLTVIVPAYNEERRLPASLKVLRDFLEDWGIDYRVLVVDDGSDDRTNQCSEGMGWRMTTLSLPRQSGKGAAVRAGMLSATGRVVAFTDADVPYKLDALRDAYYQILEGRCHAVVGARDAAGARRLAPRRGLRTAASFVFRQFIRLLVSRRITDTQCGLKVFSREAAVEVFSRAVVDGFAFDAEAIFLANRLGLLLERIPVTLVHDDTSTVSLTRHALPTLLDLARLRFRDWQGRYDLQARFAGPAIRETIVDRGAARQVA